MAAVTDGRQTRTGGGRSSGEWWAVFFNLQFLQFHLLLHQFGNLYSFVNFFFFSNFLVKVLPQSKGVY
ncbi:unnamed protein product [Cuscuta campestris]|uniref:Uncharacterized protein n=1 Tax=Cuscuta campestris TaxID=132261 RepID=A0A484K562_9ASTE|nr:unnamed protein product [Cuscuta campestris]